MAGVHNLGSTCYLSSPLTCFRCLAEELLYPLLDAPKGPTPSRFVEALRHDLGPTRGVHTLQNISPTACHAYTQKFFRDGGPQDSHAVLMHALGDVQDNCPAGAARFMLTMHETTTCTTPGCTHESARTTPLTTLIVPFTSERTYASGVAQMLSSVRPEGATCERCSGRDTLVTVPRLDAPAANRVIIVHIPRPVRLPNTPVANIPLYFMDATYQLRAFTINTGGHYVSVWSAKRTDAIGRTVLTWYLTSDASTRALDGSSATLQRLVAQAYVLYYARV